MASNINLKRSSVSGKTPSVDNLSLGELGVNTYDGKIFLKQDQGGVGVGTTVITVNPWGVGVGSTAYDTYFTVGNVGIGLTNPTTLFEVNGDVRVGGALTSVGGFNIGIQTGGTDVTTGVVTALNFIGSGNTVTYNPSTKTVNISFDSSQTPFSRTVNDFTATSGQTTFAVTYTVGYVDVYVNGVYIDSSEYTATSGSSVVLNVGATAGDTVSIITYVTKGTLAVSGGSDRTKTLTIAGAGQTQFSVDYTSDGYLDVYLNGSKLNTNEYSATNGTTVGLNSAAALNDELEFIVYNPIYNDAIWTASNPGYGNTSNIYRQFGNVGIGTTNAQTLLHVASTAPYIRIQDTNSFIAADAQGGFEMYDGDGDRLFFLANDDPASADVSLFNNAGGSLKFGTSGSEKVRIDSSGRLLVGISTARSNFQVSTGFGNVTPVHQFEFNSQTYNGLSITHNAGANTYPAVLTFAKSRGSSAGSYTAVASGDGLGWLDFYGADGTNMVRAATISAEVDGTPGTNDMPCRIVFSTTADGASSPTERMRITSDGYFKASNNSTYSTASPDYHQFNQSAASQWTLGVFNRHASQPFGVTIQYLNATPNGTTNSFLLCGDATADRVQLRSNGGIANFQANDVNLSDRNAKKDISPAADTWECIKEWEIVNYRYKDQPDDADLNLGVIAQQVAESCPEVITVFQEAKEATEDQPAQEERLGVKEQQMYWMAIKALQEAQVRIETLEAKVVSLETQHQQAIETLEARVAALETQQPSS